MNYLYIVLNVLHAITAIIVLYVRIQDIVYILLNVIKYKIVNTAIILIFVKNHKYVLNVII